MCTCHGDDRILAQGPELGKGVSLVRFCLQTARSRSETPGGGQSITDPSVPSLGKAACRGRSPEFLMNHRIGQKPQVMVEDAGDSAGKRMGMGDSC